MGRNKPGKVNTPSGYPYLWKIMHSILRLELLHLHIVFLEEIKMQYTLSNDRVLVSINSNGCITEIKYDQQNYTQKGTSMILNILYSEVESKWEAKSWKVISFNRLEIVQYKEEIRLNFKGFENYMINATMVISLKGDEFIFDTCIENNDNGVVVGATAPVIGGFHDNNGFLYYPYHSGKKLYKPFEVFKEKLYRMTYPVPLSAQFIAYNTGDSGWGLYFLDKEMGYKNIYIGGLKSELKVEQYCFIESGKSGSLPSVVLKMYEGSWHSAADRYRIWFDQWSKTPVLSAQIRELPLIKHVTILARPVEDEFLSDVTKDQEVKVYGHAIDKVKKMKEEGYEGVHIVGWHDRGHDTCYPDFNISEVMGGKEEMRKMSAEFKIDGMLVGYYMNGRLGADSSEVLKQNQHWRVKVADGEQVMEKYGDERFYPLCPHSEGYIKHLKDKVVELAEQYHGDFVQLDQIGAAPGLLCFDCSHGHATPASAWSKGYEKMLQQIIEAVRKINPGFWIWIEGNWENAGQYIDLQQGGFWNDVKEAEKFYELYRYTFPKHFMMGNAILGGVPFWQGNRSVWEVNYLKRNMNFYANSRYMDTKGLVFNREFLDVRWHLGMDEIIIIVKNKTDHIIEEEVTLNISGVFEGLMSLWCIELDGKNPTLVNRTDEGFKFSISLGPLVNKGAYFKWNKNDCEDKK